MSTIYEQIDVIMCRSATDEVLRYLGIQTKLRQMKHGFCCLKCHQEVFVLEAMGVVHCGCPLPKFRLPFRYKNINPEHN